jgi:hypothetical protein
MGWTCTERRKIGIDSVVQVFRWLRVSSAWGELHQAVRGELEQAVWWTALLSYPLESETVSSFKCPLTLAPDLAVLNFSAQLIARYMYLRPPSGGQLRLNQLIGFLESLSWKPVRAPEVEGAQRGAQSQTRAGLFLAGEKIPASRTCASSSFPGV